MFPAVQEYSLYEHLAMTKALGFGARGSHLLRDRHTEVEGVSGQVPSQPRAGHEAPAAATRVPEACTQIIIDKRVFLGLYPTLGGLGLSCRSQEGQQRL